MQKVEISNIDDLNELLYKSKYLYIVGAGNYGRMLGEYLSYKQVGICGYIDKNRKGKLLDKNILDYSQIRRREDAIYIVSSVDWNDSIAKDLMAAGISEGSLIVVIKDVNLIYDAYDVVVNYSKYTDKLKDFKNIHEGERVFIIGNGPSLTIDDLEELHLNREITFGHNYIYKIYDRTKWRPTYYNVVDDFFCATVTREVLMNVANNCKNVFTSAFRDLYKYREDNELKNIFYYKEYRKPYESNILFSDKIDECVFSAGTVVFGSIQIAAYMGAKKIYLLGCDCNYPVETDRYGKRIYKNVNSYMKEIEINNNNEYKLPSDVYINPEAHINPTYLMIDEHIAAREYAKRNNIRIMNATRGGKLEVYDRVEFDSLF